jgi:putative copper resistance protein D
MESTLPQTAATALINISLAWTVGVLTSRFWLMKQTAGWQRVVVERLSPAMQAGLMVCTVGILLSLWTESAAMGDVALLDAWPVFLQLMTTTHYGHAGVAAAALLVAAMAVHRRLQGPGAGPRYVVSLTVLLLLVATARVTIGHAYEHGPLRIAVLVEWLHLSLMSIWAGVVFVAAWVVLPRVLASELAATQERAAYLTSMSNWATAALVGIMATGAYNAYRVLGSPRQLLEADYGQVLLFKLCFVLLAIVLGGFNRFMSLPSALSFGEPATKAHRGLRTVIAVLRIESIALLFVLIAAAVLGGSAPPG